MKTAYETIVLGFGNHASIEIPLRNLEEIGGNKRAPLKITVNGYMYQSTATAMNGVCMVVFPMKDREAAGVKAGDKVQVTLELDSGYREVVIPLDLKDALRSHKLTKKFDGLTYSKRKEFVRSVNDAKSAETRIRRIHKVIAYFN
jgi:bifunctional DNA-binding transcriptional regulator/antitoxin component of YhaV-PrlF toxin-antitoxin module